MLQNIKDIISFIKENPEGGCFARIVNFLFFLFFVYLVVVREDLKFALVLLAGQVYMIADRYRPRS